MSNPFLETTSAAPVAPVIDRKAILTANPGIISSARWFYWIAGLSIVNSVLTHSGSETSFVAGLGFTLVVDAVFQSLKPVAFVIDALAVAFFIAMGALAVRGHRWAFLVGGVLYAMDAVIYVLLQAWFPVIFHAWALLSLWVGGMHLHREIKAQLAAPPALADAPLEVTSTSSS